MQEKSIVLKRDVRGRVRTPVERRLAVVAEFERSGLPGSQFAKLAGIKYPTLMAWVAGKRRQASDGGAQAAPLFVEAVAAGAAAPGAALVVEFAGGARLSLTDGRQMPLAAQLLQALQHPQPC